ncbi:hypothetical protein LOTGIDRAFT_163037 [Lottia gigantea]|uniref:IGFBP N-terminal domain-containing protein n=1 Tax=Lottia gigantea TaxID=225164 RepID=V4A5Q0_LOTGI|nr:hypothetical protein LOTGIDRAFT_163037 [Lottia gigantea]ESO92032.1 hypothetical protein LOTGIDRAFT_163037 [Lottia gigantea]
MVRFFIYITLLALAGASNCPDPSICLRIFCGVVDRQCLDGTIIPNAGFCGCCPACVPNLSGVPIMMWTWCKQFQVVEPMLSYEIGDPCGHTFLTGSVQGRCPKGSICDTTSVTCKPSKVSNV